MPSSTTTAIACVPVKQDICVLVNRKDKVWTFAPSGHYWEQIQDMARYGMDICSPDGKSHRVNAISLWGSHSAATNHFFTLGYTYLP